MRVLKFGGSSVATAENLKQVATIVSNAAKKEQVVVILSALGGITDLLLNTASLAARGDERYVENISLIEKRHFDLIKQLIPVVNQSGLLSMVKKYMNELEDICSSIYLLKEFSGRSSDRVAGYGELISSQIFSTVLQFQKLNVCWKDARELIKTNDQYTNAQVNKEISLTAIQSYIHERSEDVFVLPGFIASDQNGICTTLGRGGSDYTAALVAAALQVPVLEIWTDVNGMMTADPRLVPNAKVIEKISYNEAMELSHFGAKIIYPPTLQPVMDQNIPIVIKNTFQPEHGGTIISAEEEMETRNEKNLITGISAIQEISLLSMEGSGMIGVPGFSMSLFKALSEGGISVIMITQGSSEHSICVAVKEAAATRAQQMINDAFADAIAFHKIEPVKVENGHCIIALVGEQMKSHTGVSGRMFGTLGKNGINVRAIAQGSSERNISAVIHCDDLNKAMNVLHEEFFESSVKQLHLYIAGVGNVGIRLLSQLRQQKAYLKKQLKIDVQINGISNSRKMIFFDSDRDITDWKKELEHGHQAALDVFIERIIKQNRPNSIFVDITASEDVAMSYAKLLEKSIAVVACNKIAASSSWEYYIKLKQLAAEFNTKFLFETNVGAALPVIETLNDLIRSGDKIRKIEAVLSGTLNFVFNQYDGQRSFASVVKQAQEEGYTEPDPRLDLSGVDVMRKILILAREAGIEMELHNINNNLFLPSSCMKGTVSDFYTELEKEEPYFKQLIEKASSENCRLRFVATLDQGKGSVGLQHINADSDMYQLHGKDNIILFYTDRYHEQPLIIKGAGAGSEVTASGVFADIMRIANA